MAERESKDKKVPHCPTCGKPIAQDNRAGSLTSYLFQSSYCSCASPGDKRPRPSGSGRSASSAGADKTTEQEFCPRCGLKTGAGPSAGSITGFLFQDTRCKCQLEPAAATNEMAQRYQKLKEKNTGGIGGGIGSDKESALGPSINLSPGTIIGGAYRIVELVGEGGMGEVYLAFHETLGKPCALKIVRPDHLTDTGWQRFQLEAKAHAGLDHINLVKVTDLGIHEGCLPYYSMEYIEGQTLTDLLRRYGRLPLDMALDVFIQVSDGIDYAHRKGLLHRDLKPGNIMLVKLASDKFLVKVVDFGLVKQTNFDRTAQSLTAVGNIMGSPFYMSPEQCDGGKIDNRSDIYSIGCTLFESLAGSPPFIGDSPLSIVVAQQLADPPSLEEVTGEKFPPSIEVVLAKLLRKNPVERYQTLLELRGDLEAVARGEEVQPVYVSRAKQPYDENNPDRLFIDDDQDDENATSQPTYESEPSRRPIGIAMLAAVILISAAILGIPLILPKPPAKVAVKPLTKDEILVGVPYLHEDPLPEPASIKDTAPYFVGIKNGNKIFKFPKDVSLGDLTKPNWQATPAQGTVVWPADLPMGFQPTQGAKQFPTYLKRFGAGDFQTLRMADFDVINPGHDQGQQKFLDALTAVPGIPCLDLQFCYSLSSSDFPWLNKFKSLTKLMLAHADFELEDLAKTPILMRLKTLFLLEYENSAVVLKALQQSQELEMLYMRGYALTLPEAEMVASIPKLVDYTCGTVKPDTAATTTEIIKILSKANRLQRLSITSMKLDKSTLSALQNFRSLQTLQTDLKLIDGPMQKQLHKTVPRLSLVQWAQ